MADPANSGIYEIVNLVNGKRYIGSAVDIAARWYMHRWALGAKRHHSFKLQLAWDKYGADSFEFRVLENCDTTILVGREQHYFDELKPAYNVALTAGGGGGLTMSEAGRLKIAESNRRRTGWEMSEESKAKIGLANRGNTATKGKKRDRDAVEKTAAAHRGMKRSDQTRAKISAALAGKKRQPFSAETRAKLSAAIRARPFNPDRVAKMAATKRGSKLTAEHKAKIGEASRRMWAARKAALT